jgi:hypothetical protein
MGGLGHCRRPRNNAREQIGDGVPVAPHCGNVIAERPAGDTVQVAALVVIGQGQVGHAERFPPPHLLAPFGLGAGACRDPRVDADRRRIAPGFLGVAVQGRKGRARFFAGRIGERHPSITTLGAALQVPLRRL